MTEKCKACGCRLVNGLCPNCACDPPLAGTVVVQPTFGGTIAGGIVSTDALRQAEAARDIAVAALAELRAELDAVAAARAELLGERDLLREQVADLNAGCVEYERTIADLLTALRALVDRCQRIGGYTTPEQQHELWFARALLDKHGVKL